MARSCGADPAGMTVAAGEDLALYLEACDSLARPLRPPRRYAAIEDLLDAEGEEDLNNG